MSSVSTIAQLSTRSSDFLALFTSLSTNARGAVAFATGSPGVSEAGSSPTSSKTPKLQVAEATGGVWRGAGRDYPTKERALRNIRIQGPDSPSQKPAGRHESCTERKPRSGCGIMIVARPSSVVKPVRPSSLPFGLNG